MRDGRRMDGSVAHCAQWLKYYSVSHNPLPGGSPPRVYENYHIDHLHVSFSHLSEPLLDAPLCLSLSPLYCFLLFLFVYAIVSALIWPWPVAVIAAGSIIWKQKARRVGNIIAYRQAELLHTHTSIQTYTYCSTFSSRQRRERYSGHSVAGNKNCGLSHAVLGLCLSAM